MTICIFQISTQIIYVHARTPFPFVFSFFSVTYIISQNFQKKNYHIYKIYSILYMNRELYFEILIYYLIYYHNFFSYLTGNSTIQFVYL